MSRPNPNFRDLRTSFEGRSKPTTATTFRSTAGDLADMLPQQSGKRVPALARSIDAVLDTSPAPPSIRPPLAKLRPSWIGPPPSERPQTPGIQVMKQSVTVEYSSEGLQPPVYICTSLSDPQWEPVEMHCEAKDKDGFRFSQSFQVEEGEYQYKFRLGPGDWWACDESKPTVDDGEGNKNNLLQVKQQPILGAAKPNVEVAIPTMQAEDKQSAVKAPDTPSVPSLSPPPATVVPPAQPQPHQPDFITQKEEVFRPSKGAMDEHTPEMETSNPAEFDEEDSGNENHSPGLLEHEQLNAALSKGSESSMEDSDSSSESTEEDDEKTSTISTPLLRHESFVRPPPTDSLGQNHQTNEAVSTPWKTLVKFPTHHAGIIEMIINTQQRLPADDISDEALNVLSLTHPLSEIPASLRSLPQIREAEEEMLLKIREAEEHEVEQEEADGEELDPLRVGADHGAAEPEDADFEPKTHTSPGTVEIEERIVIEIVEERKGFVESLMDNVGGRGNAIAMVVGLLVIAAGICTMQFL